MELVNSALGRAIVLTGLSATLGACSIFGGGKSELVRADPALQELPANGPEADYPQVLGDAFMVDGQEYVPVDTASYDAVGYAALDSEGGQGITLAHKTLPLPSYVEVTELASGRTILARVERRGPMTNSRLIALSPGANAALGITDGAPVRVRRVNPPETDRAELRAGRKASDRMDTPKSLLSVLQRKLPPAGVGYAPVRTAQAVPAAPPKPAAAPVPAAQPQPRELAAGVQPAPAKPSVPGMGERTANTAYPLGSARAAAPVMTQRPRAATQPAAAASSVAAAPVQAAAQADAAKGDFVIQAAAFASKANADRAAGKIGGFVTKSGAIYRVRTGPYANRGQAEAALAKVRAAGYSDARVFTAG